MDPTALQITWFFLVMFLLGGYAILDGFDLGVGVLSMFRKKAENRRIMINAIGPVWDGNEVWLLTGGGALFAAFPPVYATVFEGFYIALMLVLAFLIMRAVSMEFRHQVDSDAWRRFWDWCFGIGSFGPALLFGVAVGNVIGGVPLDAEGAYMGGFFGLLNPFALSVGLLGLVMFICHGANYMALKCDGELREKMQAWATKTWMAWVVLYVVTTVLAFLFANHLMDGVLGNPLTWVFFLLTLGSLAMMPVFLKAGSMGRAFLASATGILSMMGLAAVGMFPRMLVSSTDLAYSLTAANASATPRSLTTMLIIALIGMPFVLGYSFFVYRIFKGKVVIDESSY